MNSRNRQRNRNGRCHPERRCANSSDENSSSEGYRANTQIAGPLKSLLTMAAISTLQHAGRLILKAIARRKELAAPLPTGQLTDRNREILIVPQKVESQRENDN